jgi:N-acetyl-1-D-myo-inositol-2-amino-2-deoxy-alpha-D-glucopyranoside deacetylase
MTGDAAPAGAIVAVVAHPDDEALIAGGTLALAASAGIATGVISLTRGELGPISDPRLADPDTLGSVRETELQASGAALGVDWTRCLRHPDGELPWADAEAVAAELVDVLRPARPVVLLTFGEDGLYGHPDHVATRHIAGRATALLGRGGPRLYEAAWSPGLAAGMVAAAARRSLPTSLWGLDPLAFGSPPAGPTTRVDVRPVLERKLRALRAHRTQLGRDHLLSGLPDDLAARFLGEEMWRAADCGPAITDVLASLFGLVGNAA